MSNWWRPTFTFMSCLRVRKSASMHSITSWYPQSYTSGPSSSVPTAQSKHYCSHFRVYYYLFVCLLPVFTALAFQPSHGERKVQHSHSVILRNPLHRTPSIINQNYGIITRLGFLSWFFVFLKKKAFLKIMAHPRQKQEHPHGNRIQISIPGSQNTCFRALLNVGTGGSCSSLGAFLFFSYSFPGWFYSSLRDSRWWWRWILGYYRKWHFIWGNLFDFNFMHIWSQKIRMRIKKNIYLSI